MKYWPLFVSLFISSLSFATDMPPVHASCKQAGMQPVAVYLVRHGEKSTAEADNRDPALNAAGRQRAEQLAQVLSAQQLQGIFTTDYRRTRETAAPVAAKQQIAVTEYDPRALAEFASKLCQGSGTSLVVGHSNTTPQLVALLGGEPGTAIDEASEYDRLYLVVRIGGQVSTFLQRYGDASPAR